MKIFWNGFVNFCLLFIGLRFAYLGFISIIHFNANFSIPEKTTSSINAFGIVSSSFNDGYNSGGKIGYVIGYFIRIPFAIALLSLFYERVFKKSRS